MPRAVAVVLAILLAVLVAAGAVLYLAFGLAGRPPSDVAIFGIGDSASVTIHRNGSASIRARDALDAATALGYLHGQQHAWNLVLWRRTALGRLAEWFGDDLIELDRLTRRLGIARTAQNAYAALPDEDAARLDAYARGVNAALQRNHVRLSDELVILEAVPMDWEPWHTLAIERLYAWLAAERPHPDSIRAAGPEVGHLFETDALLRGWLHVHGFENSIAWAVRDSAGTRLFQRHVYGATTLPIYQEVTLEWPGSNPVVGASLIGTPFLPAGRTGGQAWAVILSSPMRLERAVRSEDPAQIVYDRLYSLGGQEHLLAVERSLDEIFFETAEPASDTLAVPPGPPGRHGWALQWSGFRFATDVRAWESLRTDQPAPFELFEGDGLIVTRDGDVRVLGSPLVEASSSRGVLIGNSEWSRYAAERLAGLAEAETDPSVIRSDRTSLWAQQLVPALMPGIAASPDDPLALFEALAFLRNWDFSYDRASIAGTIFDTWMSSYRDRAGHFPAPAAPESDSPERFLLNEVLVKAVQALTDTHGDDMSQWRWEQAQPHRYHFPVWSADTLLSSRPGLLARTRYAPILIPGTGHPTTLVWGVSTILEGRPSPASWESWVTTYDWGTYRFRHRRFEASRFLGRYLVSERLPESEVIAVTEPVRYTVRLLPK